jgi:hypothetical protein
MRIAMLLVTMLTLAAAHTSAASSFPCHWTWDLQYGMRPGYVTAGDNANCAGRPGSLTLKVQLLQRDEATDSWRTVKRRTRTFHHLNGNRFLEVAAPCAPAKFKAVMRWVLRNPGGAVVARHVVHTGVVAVPGPNCLQAIG